MRPADDTPVMRQFRAAKEQHPDAIVFFRMGDFYELFYEDAVVASRALELTLTSRNKDADAKIPMAGVPHHAASGYVQRLLEQGFKVAICEQMADPKTVKGIVPRAVVRVVSPGLTYDDNGIVPGQNHWVVAVSEHGFAALDFTTGELLAAEIDGRETLAAELARFDPKEIVLEPDVEQSLAGEIALLRPKTSRRIAAQPFAADLPALHALVAEAEATRIQPSLPARAAAAALVAVLRVAEPMLASLPLRLLRHEPGEHLILDESTQGHLELVRSMAGEVETSLLAQLDRTKTAAGARLMRRRLLAPLRDAAAIRRRHDQVECLLSQPRERDALREALGQVGDLERIAIKLSTGRVEPKNLGALRRTLLVLPEVTRSVLAAAATLVGIDAPRIDEGADLAELLARALAETLPAKMGDGPLFAPGYDAELDAARDLQNGGEQLLLECEERLRSESQIQSLKLRYTRVFGHYVEVTRSNAAKAPKTWRRKQTVANAERYTTDELDELSEKLAMAEATADARERTLFEQLVAILGTHVARLRTIMASVAEWDVAASLADVAHRHDYARPEVDDGLRLDIEEGRHPVVERMVKAGTFVPNDCSLHASDEGGMPAEAARFWVLTGPNMAGKSTFMRQVALIVLMAQMGSFVPAKRAHIGLCDRVLTRVGASDNLARGESTFMVEMKETAHVLRRATRRSLVVLDEIGRGTSTFDGLAIAWSVAEYLHDTACSRTLFATHYHELTDLVKTRPSAENYSVSAKEHDGELVFFHAIERGAASESYGIACARLAGVPESVVDRARTLLGDLEARGKNEKRRVKPQHAAPQLGLFDLAAPAKESPVLARLRDVDLDQTTPLQALQLLAELKRATP